MEFFMWLGQALVAVGIFFLIAYIVNGMSK